MLPRSWVPRISSGVYLVSQTSRLEAHQSMAQHYDVVTAMELLGLINGIEQSVESVFNGYTLFVGMSLAECPGLDRMKHYAMKRSAIRAR